MAFYGAGLHPSVDIYRLDDDEVLISRTLGSELRYELIIRKLNICFKAARGFTFGHQKLFLYSPPHLIKTHPVRNIHTIVGNDRNYFNWVIFKGFLLKVLTAFCSCT